MMVALPLAAALIALGAGAARASTPRIVAPEKGEIVRLVGSPVECSWSTLRSGLAYVECRLAGPGHRPRAGSYAARLLANGRVDIVVARSGKTVFSRTTSAVAARAPLRIGDVLHVPGTAINCSIVDAGGGAAICFRSDSGGTRRNSYGFAVGRRVVLAMAYDGKRRPRNAGAWPQPAS
jgi:hypothetical protein